MAFCDADSGYQFRQTTWIGLTLSDPRSCRHSGISSPPTVKLISVFGRVGLSEVDDRDQARRA
jgi:hypothetical protein